MSDLLIKRENAQVLLDYFLKTPEGLCASILCTDLRAPTPVPTENDILQDHQRKKTAVLKD